MVVTGGSTPRAAYERAAALLDDWSAVELWFGDERCVPPDHEHSNYGMVKAALLDRIEGRAPGVHRMQGELGPGEGAARYEEEIAAAGFGEALPAFDLMLLGLGPDAHVCSLFPGDAALGERERRVVGVETPGMAPLVSRITLTLPVVNAARRIVVLVTGEDKAEAVRRAFGDAAGPERPRQPRAAGVGLARAAARPGGGIAPRGLRMTSDAPAPVPFQGHTSPFPPIAQYAFLSDCETGALVAPSGNVEWLCLPRFDSPSVFGAILDRDAGMFRLGPADVDVPADRRYLPGTMVLETSWGTRGGWIIVRDVLLMGPWHHEDDRSHTHRRSPTDYDADHVLLRTVRCVNGEVQVLLDCEPGFDYGRLPAEWEYTGAGYHEARATSQEGELFLDAHHRHEPRLRGPARHRAHADEGGRHLLRGAVVVRAPGAPRPTRTPTTGSSGRRTTGSTGSTTASSPTTRGAPSSSAARSRSRGSPTRPPARWSPRPPPRCPETPGGERNWDYRYTWIRDATFMLWGLYTLGFDWEANDFFYFIADVAEAEEGQLQIMYGIDGEDELAERTLDHLSGYEGARPVRVGNGAYNQDQHDVWGALLDSFYLHTSRATTCPSASGRSSCGRSRRRSRTGASPTAASGRCAASPSTSPPRS